MTTLYGYTKDEFLSKYGDCFLFPEKAEDLTPEIVIKMDKIIDWLPKSEIERVTFDYGQRIVYNGIDEMSPMYYYDYNKKDLVRLRGIEYAFAQGARFTLPTILDDYDIQIWFCLQ